MLLTVHLNSSYTVTVQKQLAFLPELGCSSAEGTAGEVTGLLSVHASPSGHQAHGEEPWHTVPS